MCINLEVILYNLTSIFIKLLSILALFFTVSEAVCKEYEQLKRQYDVETNAMHKAMQQASQVTCYNLEFYQCTITKNNRENCNILFFEI